MKLTLTARLISSFALVILIMAGMVTAVVFSLNRIESRTADANTTLDTLTSGLEISAALKEVETGGLITFEDKLTADQDALAGLLPTVRKALDEAVKSADPDLEQQFKGFAAAAEGYLANVEKMLEEERAGRWEEAMAVMDNEVKPSGDKVDEAFGALHDEASKLEAACWEASDVAQAMAFRISLIGGIVALLVSVIAGIWLAVSIRRPIAILVAAADKMGLGDFTVQLHSAIVHDELGRMNDSFIQMKENTQRLIRQVAEAATQVAAASEELSAGADETGRAIQQVSVTVQEVAKGSQETVRNLAGAQENLRQNATAIEGVSRDIEEVAAYASQAASQGSQGKQSADDAVSIINRAAGSVQDTTTVVHSLGNKTRQIGEFISIITGIADQTNLLALNAAIEAARAGDAGRGFAVVAEEVRKLAEESNTAAGNITKLVKGIEEEMNNALAAMERSDKEVSDGAKTVANASALLDEIVRGVEALSDKVQSISAAAEEISASTGEVVTAMNSVAAVAEQNSASTQEVSAATQQQTASMEEIGASSNSLAKLSQDLQTVVAQFSV